MRRTPRGRRGVRVNRGPGVFAGKIDGSALGRLRELFSGQKLRTSNVLRSEPLPNLWVVPESEEPA
jgi:hypothetical protein